MAHQLTAPTLCQNRRCRSSFLSLNLIHMQEAELLAQHQRALSCKGDHISESVTP